MLILPILLFLQCIVLTISTSYFAIQPIQRGPPYVGTIDTFDPQSLSLNFYSNFSFYLPPINQTDFYWFSPGPVVVIDKNQSTIITALQAIDTNTPLHLFRYNIPTKTYIQSSWMINHSNFDYLHYDSHRQRLFGLREVNISVLVLEEYNTATLNFVQQYTQLDRSKYGYPPQVSIFDQDENWIIDIRIAVKTPNSIYFMKMDLNLVGKSDNIVTDYHKISKHGSLISMTYDIKTKRAFVLWNIDTIKTNLVMTYMDPHTGEFHQEKPFFKAQGLWYINNIQDLFDESTRQILFFIQLSDLPASQSDAYIIQVDFDTMKIIKQTRIYPNFLPIQWSFFCL
ncbi:hypothetical protein I4U23_016614 [Adineta vaga]|nr:hypothetical protein I4U23_016614 [Adineta vaga]